MKATDRHAHPTASIVIGDLVGTASGCDVSLNDHEIGLIVQLEFFDMLITYLNVIIWIAMCCEGS